MKYYVVVWLDGEEHEFEYDNLMDAVASFNQFEDEGYTAELFDENGNEY